MRCAAGTFCIVLLSCCTQPSAVIRLARHAERHAKGRQGSGRIAASNKPGRALADARKLYARSRVSNGNDFLAGTDGRSLVVRRLRDITSAIVAEQGAD